MRRTLLITTLTVLACTAVQAQEKPHNNVNVEAEATPVPATAAPVPALAPVKLARAAEPAAQMDEFETALVNLRTALVRTSRTSFLTEERIPLGELWKGRVEFAAVQQRFHNASLYSVVPANLGEISATPGIENTSGRARTAYGLSLRIHFGRNEN